MLLKSLFPFLITLLVSFGSVAQNGQVWATISNSDNVPFVNQQGSLVSNDSAFNEFIQSLNIISVKQALPSSRREDLLKVYEITCNCPQSILENTFNNSVSAVSRVYPAPKYDTLHTPNDFNLITSVNHYALNLINAQSAWDITKGDSNVIVSISDNSYSQNHSELLGKYAYINAGTSSTTHGNSVAIIAAGNTNNNNGLSSIGYKCKLGLYLMSYNEVLNAAYAGARIINISWTSGCSFNLYVQQCVDEAYDAGTFLVAAAGNGTTCGSATAYVYPASCDNVFSVTSVGASNNHDFNINNSSQTHQHNDKVDLSAPGYDVAINPSEGWYLNSYGTSLAAPYVSGTIGLMLSANPCLSRKDIDTILKISSFNIDSINPQYIGIIGVGRLDAYAAVQLALNWTTSPMAIVTNPPNTATIVLGTIQLSASSTSTFPLCQWQYDSSGIFVNLANNNTYSGVTTSTLTINNATLGLNGEQYRCVFTSGYCQATTNPATLSILTGILPVNGGPIHGDTTVCFGEIVTFAVPPALYATGYTWSIIGGNNTTIVSGLGTNVVSIQSFDAFYQLSVFATNLFGSSAPTNLNVTVLSTPTGSLNTQAIICFGDSAALQIFTSGSGPWSGTLNGNIPFSGNSSPITVWVSPISTTNYYLSSLTSVGCDALPDDLISSSTVSVLLGIFDSASITICSNQIPFQWYNNVVTQSGFFQHTITNPSGCDTIKVLQVTLLQGNPPAAPLTITQNLLSNTCNSRIYRYTASITNSATSYQWLIPLTCGGFPSVIVDSGDINSSRIIRLKYTTNQAAFTTDSIKVRAINNCGFSLYKSVRLINNLLSPPAAPLNIVVNSLVTNVCGERKYRYSAPSLLAATTNAAAATGYVWSFSSPLPLLAVLDSGTINSQTIVVKYVSNNAALAGDSIFVKYASACGFSTIKSSKINVSALNAPLSPSSITITNVITAVCGQRKYRCSMPPLTNATTVNGAATGYLWTFTGQVMTYGIIDSGTSTSRVIVIKYTNDNSTVVGDSVKAQYSSGCGPSNFRAVKFSVPKIQVPLAPSSIIIMPVSISNCNNKIYRYVMPPLFVGSVTNAKATGYEWSFTGILAASAIIDSGTINSRIIRMKFLNNNGASIGDSVKAYYLSSCGNGLVKSVKLTNTNLISPAAPSSISISLVNDLCGARVYRYSAPVLPIATTTSIAASGYEWILPTGSAVALSASLDSGVLNGTGARYIRLKYLNNAAAQAGDSIRLRYNSGCGTSANKAQKLSNLAIKTTAAPTALTGTTSICSIVGTSFTARYTASAIIGAVSYLWTIPSGAIIDSGSNGLKIKVRFFTAGPSDSIYVQAIGANACAGAKKVLRLVTLGCVTSQNSKIGTPMFSSTSDFTDVVVYPNPTTNTFQLSIKSSKSFQNIRVRIIDLQGRNLRTVSFNSNYNTTFGDDLKPGVYMLEVFGPSKIKTIRVVKY